MKQPSKQQQCMEAECAVENALARLRRAGRKNKAAAASQIRKRVSLPSEEPTLDMEDSGLHELS